MSFCETQPRGKGGRTRRKLGGGVKRWRNPKPQQTQKTREEATTTRREERGGIIGVMGNATGVGGLGGSRRPGFSSSGETEVNSATAEQTMLRTALWRRTRSPPPPQQRAWSPNGQGSRHKDCKQSRHPRVACASGASWKCGKEGYGCRERQGQQ